MSKALRNLAGSVAVVILGAAGLTGNSVAAQRLPDSPVTGTVAFLGPETPGTGRWPQDVAYIRHELRVLAPNVTLLVYNAGFSVDSQRSQVRQAISKGAEGPGSRPSQSEREGNCRQSGGRGSPCSGLRSDDPDTEARGLRFIQWSPGLQTSSEVAGSQCHQE